MKNVTMRWLAFMMAFLMIACSLVGCGGEPPASDGKLTADKLFEKIEEAMGKYSSYTMEGVAELKTIYMGVDVTVDMKMLEKTVGGEGNDYATYRRSEVIGKANGISVIDTIAIEGYSNGKIFQASGTSEEMKGIYSTLNVSDYQQFKKSDSSDFDFSIENSTVKTCEEKDGNWVATYSGYQDLSAFSSLTDAMNFMFGDASICDVKMTAVTDADFVLKNISIEFLFESADANAELPAFSADFQIKNLDATTVDDVNFKNYTEVIDVRIAHKLEAAYEARAEDTKGGFVLTLTQTTKEGNQKEVVAQETDTVTYGVKDGRLEYAIEAKTGDYIIDLSYWMGEKRTIIKTSRMDNVLDSSTTESNDEVERVFLQSLMNPASFIASNVSNIQKLEDDVYLITIANPNDTYLEQFGSDPEIEATLKVTFYNDELESVIYNCSGTVESGLVVYSYKMTAEVEFTN